MTEEFEFFEQEPDDIGTFLDREFTNHNTETTGCKTTKYSVCAKQENKIIAASRGGIFDGALYISDFIVEKTQRKTGIGRKLLKAIENHAKKMKCSKIWVDTYEYQAPEFYKKNNFIEKGRIKNYRGKHAKIFFEKEI